MSDFPSYRDILDRSLTNTLAFIDGCDPLPEDDPDTTCIRCIAETVYTEGLFDSKWSFGKLRPLVDTDLADHLPVEGSPEYGQETFSQIAFAQVTRTARRLVDKNRAHGSHDPSAKLTHLLAGKIGENPCAQPDLPIIPNVRTWLSSQSVQQSMWAAGAAPFGDLSKAGETLGALSGLAALQPLAFRLSNHTALVRSISGSDLLAEIKDAAGQDRVRITKDFFNRYAPALTGSDVSYGESRASFGRVVRVRQTTKDTRPIPVYGGVLIASYDQDDRLTFVTNSCYPLPDARFADRFPRSQAEAHEIAVGFIADMVQAERKAGAADTAQDSALEGPTFETLPGDDFYTPADSRAGQVVLPVLIYKDQVFTTETIDACDIDGVTPDYLAAWAIWVIEPASGRSWMVMVEGEPRDDRGPVLMAIEEVGGASVHGDVFPTVAHALGVNGLGGVNEELANTLSETLTDAPDFALPGNKPVSARFLSVYYHLVAGKGQFREIIEHAWPNSVNRPKLPDNSTGLTIEMLSTPGDSGYTYAPRVITFPTGCPANGHPLIEDPALDPEVIYHEYAHAVFCEVQPDLQNSGNSIFRRAIDEGLAFYYACSLSDRLVRKLAPAAQAAITQPYRWGKVSRSAIGWVDHAYRDLERWQTQDGQAARQRPDHDYLTAYDIFPGFAAGWDDPDSKQYAVGMLWARTLWDIRQVLGPEWTDAVILRGMHLAGGVQSDLETPAEAIIHVDHELAAETGGPSHGNALRLIFASRGIFADSPIRAIIQVEVGLGQALLAATESPLNGDAACGCLISLDGGSTWQPLGMNGPRDVAALTWLPGPPNQATVWAAAESWIDSADATPAQTISRYDLRFDQAGNVLNLSDAWRLLPLLLTSATVRSLAATPADPGVPGGIVWLFAGTENGIFKFDGAKWPGNGLRNAKDDNLDFAILDLNVVAKNGQRRLVAATARTVEVYEICPIAIQEANDESALIRRLPPCLMPGLSLQSDSAIGSQQATTVWVGTRDAGMWELDPFPADPLFAEALGAWPGGGQPKPAVFAVARELNAAQPSFWAGANRGLFRKIANGNWEQMDLGAPELNNVTILALCQIGNQWLLGTAQRGLWRYEPQSHSAVRLTNNVDRLAVSEPVPQDDCAGFTGTRLPAGRTNTHVMPVLAVPAAGLHFTVRVEPNNGLERVELFHASLSIDLAGNKHAGVQRIEALVQNPAGTFELVLPNNSLAGYYLVAVRAGAAQACYSLTTNF